MVPSLPGHSKLMKTDSVSGLHLAEKRTGTPLASCLTPFGLDFLICKLRLICPVLSPSELIMRIKCDGRQEALLKCNSQVWVVLAVGFTLGFSHMAHRPKGASGVALGSRDPIPTSARAILLLWALSHLLEFWGKLHLKKGFSS